MAFGRSYLLVLTCLGVLGGASDARANPTLHPFQANAGVLPPNQAFLECTTCHVGAGGGGACDFGPCFNPFGLAYRQNNTGWAAVGGLNSDNDNRTNSQEVQTDLTSPGFPNGAASVGCSMETCAVNGSHACGGNVVCTSTRSTFAANRSYYTFGFACAPHTSGTLLLGDGSWVGDCVDTNECAGNPCGAGSCAQRPLGSWTSPGYDCSCPGGYATNGTTCVVTNDCVANVDTCVALATCGDTPGVGNFTCTCPSGYAGNGRSPGTGCTDINECAPNPCGAGTCAQIPIGAWSSPGYTCSCPPGYLTDGTTCVVSDECTTNMDDCDPAADCTDPSAAIGDYACACPSPAYVGDGYASGTGCTNVNECLDAALFTCAENSSCVDAVGSYTCVCDAGFALMAGDCVDIDECQVASVCPAGESCSNTSGTFACLCPLGTSRPAPGETCIVMCGDGTRDPSEDCDDGDTDAGDGCSPTCSVEPGFYCTGIAPGPASVCDTTCGDRLIDPPETCDDGANNSDTAPNACRTSCALAYCGDGVVDEGETCDRGGVLPADANPSACTVEGCAMVAPDAGADFGGGGGCVITPATRADGASYAAAMVLALAVIRRRRRA